MLGSTVACLSMAELGKEAKGPLAAAGMMPAALAQQAVAMGVGLVQVIVAAVVRF